MKQEDVFSIKIRLSNWNILFFFLRYS